MGYSLRSGFPHSGICGSKLVCQLPAAYRKLLRPSSPVIAKASTTCTYSLDPIALRTPEYKSRSSEALLPHHLSSLGTVETLVDTITIDIRSSRTSIDFIQIVKEQPIVHEERTANCPERTTRESRLDTNTQQKGITKKIGGGERDRTDDPLLAKQVLSQLSYTPEEIRGGSGWVRTSDPRLIKTVL